MSENWGWPKSAEKFYFIENESECSRAYKFVSDPVAYLTNFRDYLVSESIPDADLATAAISEIFELEVVIGNEDLPVTDQRLSIFLSSPIQSKEWATSPFSLLRDAGYTKSEVATYIALDDPEFSHEERLREKGLNVFLSEVYGEEK